MRTARCVRSKNGPQASRSAEAVIRHESVEPPGADSLDPVREFTQRCTDVLEMYVRRHPDLWLWMHRRWRERDVQENWHRESFFEDSVTDK